MIFGLRRTGFFLIGSGLGSLPIYFQMHAITKKNSLELKDELSKQRDLVYMIKLNELTRNFPEVKSE